MKKVLILTFLSLSLLNCANNDNEQNNQITEAIQGKWKLVQLLYYDSQNPNDEHFVNDGYQTEFNLNNTFTSNLLEEFQNGVYTGGIYTVSEDSILTLKFKAISFPERVYLKRIKTVTPTVLDLSDDLSFDGSDCVEGCGERFQRIASQQ